MLGIHTGGNVTQRNWDRQNFYQLPALAALLWVQDNGLQAEAFGTCPVNAPMQVGIPGQQNPKFMVPSINNSAARNSEFM